MRVLVTGAAGFVGSHVCDALLVAGHHVVGVDAFIDYYDRAEKEANLVSASRSPAFTFAEVDLRDGALERLCAGIDAVVHEAAMPGLPRSWEDFSAYDSCNVLATQRLLDACRRAAVGRVVHVSTSSVYGREADGDESLPTRPVSPYGVTKLAAEHLVHAYGEAFGLDYVILRYFSIYGPRQRPDMAYRRFIEALLDDRPITVYGDGTQSRSNTYVDDCVRGTLLALGHGRRGETYNLGGGEVVALRDAIDVVAGEVGVTPKIEYADARPGDQRHTRADCTKAARDFGYRPEVGVAEGLAREVAWVRARRPPRR